MAAAVVDLQEKGEVELAPSSPGYYRRLFVTPKVTGGWRPVIDLSRLNRSVDVSFPYGDLSVGASFPPSGGLDGIFRPSRYLPSGSGTSFLSPLPEVLRGRFRFTVPLPLFRSFDGSADVYPCHSPDLLYNASLRLQDPPVLGRLARPRILVAGDCAGEGLPPLVMSGAGYPHQHRK